MYVHFELRLRQRRCKTCGEPSGRFKLCRDCYEMKQRDDELDALRREEERQERRRS